MVKLGISYHVALGSLLAAATAVPLAAEAPGTAYLLDIGEPSIVTIDATTGTTAAKVPLTGKPDFMLLSPDGRRMVVPDRPEGRATGVYQFKPKTESTLSIVDLPGRRVLARVTVGWGLHAPVWTYHPRKSLRVEGHWSPASVIFGSEGKTVLVMTPGFWPKKGAGELPGALVQLDLESGAELERVTLDSRPVALRPAPDGSRLLVLLPDEALLFSVAPRLERVAAIASSGPFQDAFFSADGSYLYLVDSGAEEGAAGTLRICSAENGSVLGEHPAGRAPFQMLGDGSRRQVLMLSNGAAEGGGGSRGRLSVLRGGEAPEVISVPASPRQVREVPGSDRALVVGGDALSVVDLVSLQAAPRIPVEGDIVEVAVSRGGSRAFALDAGANAVIGIDLDGGELLSVVPVVTEGEKAGRLFGEIFAAAAAGYMSAMSAQAWAAEGHYFTPSFFHNNFTRYWSDLSVPNAYLAVRPDGEVAYVLNARNGKVAFIDAESGRLLERRKVGGDSMRLVDEGRILLVHDNTEINALDTATHERRPMTHPVKGIQVESINLSMRPIRRLQLSADGGELFLLGGKWLAAMDVATGDLLWKLDGFQRTDRIMMSPGSDDSANPP